MHAVPYPLRAALGSTVGVWIIGRVDKEVRGRNAVLLDRPPLHGLLHYIVLLHPHLPQRLHGGNFTQPRGGVGGVQRGEQGMTIAPDSFRFHAALRFARWEAVV